MAEGPPAPSLEELAKPKSSQSEKPLHHISETEGKEVETPARQLSEAQQEPPAAALQTTSSEHKASEISDQPLSHPSSTSPSPPLTFQELWRKPTITIFRSGCSVKVSTEYRGKLLRALKPSSTAILPEKPPPRTDQPRSVSILEYTDKADDEAKGEDVVHESVRAIKQRQKTASIPSAEPAREAATKLYQTQEFFQIKQLPKPFPEKINVECLPVLYHVEYNLKIHGARNSSLLPNKPAKIFAILQEELFKRYNCDCVEVEVTDFQKYIDKERNPVIPDAVKKRDIAEVARILRVVSVLQMLKDWSVFDSVLLRPLRFQVDGSLQTCGVALKLGWAIHTGGGFGYNSERFSKGMALYDDLLHCLLILSGIPSVYHVDHILVINCDAHQSSSYKHIREIKCKVTILDFYFVKMPESEKPRSQYHNELVDYKPIEKDATDRLGNVHREIESVIQQFEIKPTLCIYIAGTNVISHLGVSAFQIERSVQRALDVFETVQMKFKIPIAVLLGGGNEETDVIAAANSIIELCKVGWNKLNINAIEQ